MLNFISDVSSIGAFILIIYQYFLSRKKILVYYTKNKNLPFTEPSMFIKIVNNQSFIMEYLRFYFIIFYENSHGDICQQPIGERGSDLFSTISVGPGQCVFNGINSGFIFNNFFENNKKSYGEIKRFISFEIKIVHDGRVLYRKNSNSFINSVLVFVVFYYYLYINLIENKLKSIDEQISYPMYFKSIFIIRRLNKRLERKKNKSLNL